MLHLENSHTEGPSHTLGTNYIRAYGHHVFETLSFGSVSVVSEPGWNEYLETIQDNVRDLQPLSLSPELITTQDDFSRIRYRQDQIDSRVEKVRKLSRKARYTTFILGTPVFDRTQNLPTNSMLSIKNGAVIARKNKWYIHPDTEESATFRIAKQARDAAYPEKQIGMVICSDVINLAYFQPIKRFHTNRRNRADDYDPSVNDETTIALMSACWSTPLKVNGLVATSALPDEQRYKSQLEASVDALFKQYPNLKDLVVADRVPDGSKVDGPLNCHYSRQRLSLASS